MDKLLVANLEKYPARTTADQEFRYSKLDPSLSLFLLANIAPATLSKSNVYGPAKLLPHKL